jgi:hypothetical protein
MMALHHLRGEVMAGEYALNPAVIDGSVVAIPHDPRQFANGKGMRHGQPNDVWLDVPGQQDVRPRLPSCMGQGAPVHQAQQATTLKALQIPRTLQSHRPPPSVACLSRYRGKWASDQVFRLYPNSVNSI